MGKAPFCFEIISLRAQIAFVFVVIVNEAILDCPALPACVGLEIEIKMILANKTVVCSRKVKIAVVDISENFAFVISQKKAANAFVAAISDGEVGEAVENRSNSETLAVPQIVVNLTC